MNIWLLFAAIVGGWMIQLWLAYKQSQSYLASSRELRAHGTVATGSGGRRYRGGVAFVSLATDGRRVTAARSLRGFTTWARPADVPALVGLRLGVVAGDRPIPGLRDNERAAAREAATTLRAARGATETPAATSSPSGTTTPLPAGALHPA